MEGFVVQELSRPLKTIRSTFLLVYILKRLDNVYPILSDNQRQSLLFLTCLDIIDRLLCENLPLYNNLWFESSLWYLFSNV